MLFFVCLIYVMQMRFIALTAGNGPPMASGKPHLYEHCGRS